jgi:RNA polymerase sigma-32 factor
MAHIDDTDTQRANLNFIKLAMHQPLLSRDVEFNLARRWQEDGDDDALHRLVKAYSRLVISISTRFRNYGLPAGDLVQEGNVGLMQAAARFDPDREVRFSTYATWWIRSAMQDYVLRNWSIVRTGTTAAQKTLFFNFRRLRARIDKDLGRRMSDDGRRFVATELKVGVDAVASMEARLNSADQSLNSPLADGTDDTWQDFLADSRPNPEDAVIGIRDSLSRSRWLAEALSELGPREQIIIRKRRLDEDGATLEALGRELGVSKERVRQLEYRALRKLRDLMREKVEVSGDLLIDA